MNYDKYLEIMKAECFDSRLHGYNHMKHVYLIARELLKHYPEANENNVLMACIFHDVKRQNDNEDKNHSYRSAEWFKKNFKGMDKKISLLINDHNKEVLNPSLELKILKDSDTLSRVRFDGFNPKHLLLIEKSFYLVSFSKDEWFNMHEIDDIVNIFSDDVNKGRSILKNIERMSTYNYLLTKRGIGDLKDFLDNRYFLPDQLYFQYLRSWLSANYHNIVINTLKALLKERDNTNLLMNENELNELSKLDDILTVYRGCIDQNKDGLSWTLNKSEAINYIKDNDGYLIEKQINKSDVIAYFMDNGKQEIILLGGYK
jgi:hypothetical protein